MTETQETITQWAEQTFGKSTALDRLIRCNVEAAELISAIHNGASTRIIAGELADVMIIFMQVRESLGYREKVDLYPGVMGSALTYAAEIGTRLTGLMEILLLPPAKGSHWQARNVLVCNRLFDIESCILVVADAIGVDLQAEVDVKMQINRARSWQRLESGRFQHA